MEQDLFIVGTLIFSIGTIIPKIGAYIKAVGIACIVACFAIILINIPLALFVIFSVLAVISFGVCMLLPTPKFIDEIQNNLVNNLKNKIERDK